MGIAAQMRKGTDMIQHNVGVSGAVAMGVIFIAAKVFLAFPRTMAELGAQAAWLIVLIACLVSPIGWWGIRALLRQHPGSSLLGATEAALGPVLGSVANLMYFTFFFFTTFIVLRQFGANIVATVMPRTPVEASIFVLLLGIAYLAYLGMEAICRVSWLFGPFMLIGLAALLAGGYYTRHETNALMPFWGSGMGVVLGWGLVKSSLLGELLIFGIIAPAFRKADNLNRAVTWTIIISATVTVLSVIAYTFAFPHPASTAIGFPLLEVSRIIIGGRWLQRLESVFLIIWVFSAVIKLGVGLYGAAQCVAQVIGYPNYRHLLFPLAILIYSCSLIPSNLTQAVSWDAEILRNYGWTVSILLPWVTWLASELRGKGGERHDAS